MIRPRPLALALVLLTLPGAALAWRAWNCHEVFALADGIFEVIGKPGSGPQDFWCGAGDYALRVLGVKVGQRIYTWRGIGPSMARPGRKAMQFALAPPGGADTSPALSLSLTRAGDNLSVAMARQYCHDDPDPWNRWWF